MPSEKLRVLLDSLGTVSEEGRARLGAGRAAVAPSVNPLGLKFVEGVRVLDLVTGRSGVVQLGTRDSQTGAEFYRVRLEDASTQYRSRDQLEPAPPAAGR